MTSGIEWMQMKRLEESADRVGMKVVYAKHGEFRLSLIPKDRCLPVYSRDAELATGSVEHLISVIQGWEKANQYLLLLRAVKKEKITKCEEQAEQEHTIHTLKTGKAFPGVKVSGV